MRPDSLHYGSDAGAEMAATYHSVIGTVKLHVSSIWNFIGTFLIKNRHKAQRKAKFYINKCRSASCMQGGLKQASA